LKKAAKKDEFDDTDLEVIGIATSLKDVTLLWQLNNTLHFKFKYFGAIALDDNNIDTFPYFIDNESRQFQHALFYNRYNTYTLVPAFKQIDFFLVSYVKLYEEEMTALLKELKSISGISIAMHLSEPKKNAFQIFYIL
jgi:hypothetical protein